MKGSMYVCEPKVRYACHVCGRFFDVPAVGTDVPNNKCWHYDVNGIEYIQIMECAEIKQVDLSGRDK